MRRIIRRATIRVARRTFVAIRITSLTTSGVAQRLATAVLFLHILPNAGVAGRRSVSMRMR